MKRFLLILLLAVSTGITGAFAQAPQILSFSPASGPAGSKVTISGTGFGEAVTDNVIYFGATRATINTAGKSHIVVTVPQGATYSTITVTNKVTKLTCRSTLPFTPVFPMADAAFAPKLKLPFDATVSDVKIADIDGDGKTDILATNPVKGTLMVFRNKTKNNQLDTGSFASPLNYPAGSQSGIVGIEDVDGDGSLDIVLFKNGFHPDLNGNNSLAVFRNLSKPDSIRLSLALVSDSTKNVPASYAFRLKPGDCMARITDIDGDGRPDVAVLNTGGFISIYQHNESQNKPVKDLFRLPVTLQTGLHPSAFVVGDIDSDGKPDIITASRDSSSATILRNISSAGARSQTSFQRLDFKLDYQPLSVSLIDADKDGKLDLAISRPDNKLSLIRNTSSTGRISFNSVVFSNIKILSNFSNDVVIQDINGDGKPDLLSLDDKYNALLLYMNKTVPGQTLQNYFNDQEDFDSFNMPDCIGDLDGDNRPDLIAGNYFGIGIYRNYVPGGQALADSLKQMMVEQPDYMNLYPNPATTYTHVKYYLPARAEVRVNVYDNFGVVQRSFHIGEKAPGDNVSRIETSGLRMGVYVVTITAGSFNKTGRLLIK